MRRTLALLALFLLPGRTLADVRGGTRAVEARIVTSTDTLRAGEKFMVAVALKIAPDWRIFWKNPGETGVATKIVFTLPESFQVSEVMWPNPEHLRQGDLGVYAYTGEVVFLVRATPPANLPKGLFSVTAQVNWIESGKRTAPGSATLTLAMPSATGPSPKSAERDRFFAAALAQTSQVLADVRAKYVIKGDFLELTVNRPGGFGDGLDFFPADPGFIETRLPPKFTQSANGVVFRFQRPSDAPRVGELKGVLISGKGAGRKGYEVSASPADVKAH